MNRLGQEKSPYLRQHQHNPVHWYPWAPEAFAAAQKEQKPIFLSIGYATCHWCHVMERDCFENDEVAALLNRDFISIKVDREERPDIDQIYMDAVVGLTGHGGWPMSVFLTPQREPFFGGTYFPRPRFLQLLSAIALGWKQDQTQVIESAAQITQALRQQEVAETGHFDLSVAWQQAIQQLQRSFDAEHGGFGGAPKFPRTMSLMLLMRHYQSSHDPNILQILETSLKAMGNGGIYDHLGGGFSRYATDAQWVVPHFEKMLYDNALLTMTYLEMAQITHEPFYAKVAHDTLNYVLNEMNHPQGGYYSAQDADSEGEEGKYYVWHHDELATSLPAATFTQFAAAFQVTQSGNFEHQTNILHLPIDSDWSVKDAAWFGESRRELLQIRQARVAPLKDDKILTSWNGLMIAAMAFGSRVLNEPRFLASAQAAARFLQDKLMGDGHLLRRYRDGESKHLADLNDYAFLIHGLLTLFQVDGNVAWVDMAKTLQSQQDQFFWDPAAGGYFYSSSQVTDLLLRKKEFDDGALPAGNALATQNLLRLAVLTGEVGHRNRVEQLVSVAAPFVARYPMGSSQMLVAMREATLGLSEIILVGERQGELAKQLEMHLREQFLPSSLVLIGMASDTSSLAPLRGRSLLNAKDTITICHQQVCQAPTNDWSVAERLLLQQQGGKTA